jgi:hypothetical protein
MNRSSLLKKHFIMVGEKRSLIKWGERAMNLSQNTDSRHGVQFNTPPSPLLHELRSERLECGHR